MFPRLPLRPFDCPYLFACVFGIKIVEEVSKVKLNDKKDMD